MVCEGGGVAAHPNAPQYMGGGLIRSDLAASLIWEAAPNNASAASARVLLEPSRLQASSAAPDQEAAAKSDGTCISTHG